MKASKKLLAAALAMQLAGQAWAAHPVSTAKVGPAQVLVALRRAHPGTAFGEVKPTPVPGLYEVHMGANVAYVTGHDTRYLLFGHLFDTVTLQDLTPSLDRGAASSAPEAPAARVDVAALPLADALKEVKGTGRRTLFVFADPHCGYCRQLDGELAKLDDVTIYTFMVPMLEHSAPVSIWCAPDRLGTWRAAMHGTEPTNPGTCTHPIDRNAALASRLGVRGTPTMVFADGSRLESAAGADVIEDRLSAANRSPHHE